MRLIDAHRLFEAMLWIKGQFVAGIGEVVNAIDVFEQIKDAPTIDAVEVVRCCDCKHLRIDSDFHEKRYCAIRNVNGGRFCKDEDYCSYGERRREEDDGKM